MPPQARLGDKALITADAHGCVACPHTASGPAVAGSPNVNVNGRPAIRVDDPGIHTACCGGNTWNAQTGSKSVFINGKPAHRLGDVVRHCGGVGKCIEGSGNVIVGDEGGTGGTASESASVAPVFEGGFQLIDDDGHPLIGASYVIRAQSGQEYFGHTDADGLTQLVETDSPEELTIEILQSECCGD